jgi:hypothetical protein
MKLTRFVTLFVLVVALALVGCEPDNSPIVDDPTQEEGSDDEGGSTGNDDDNTGGNEDNNTGGNEDDDNGSGDEGNNGSQEDNSWIENPTPMPEATYSLNERLVVSTYVSYADGCRNDYMTFYQESTGYAVYLDIYTSEDNTMLETGRYLLANTPSNAVYYEWSYFTPYTNSPVSAFSETGDLDYCSMRRGAICASNSSR